MSWSECRGRQHIVHSHVYTNLPYPSDTHLEGFMYIDRDDYAPSLPPLYSNSLVHTYTWVMFIQFLWGVWKWLLRLFTGQCELERLCYKKLPIHQLALRVGTLLCELLLI